MWHKLTRKRRLQGPIFIFAASWRTGSTLLQRIVNASGEVYIWGEPSFLKDALLFHQKVESYLSKVEINRRKAFTKKIGQWIPVVSPQPEMSSRSFREFFNTLYGTETNARGIPRWGFKEVRANAVAHMNFLLKIYPDARLLFLVRNPWNMYLSIKGKKFHQNFANVLDPVQVWQQNVDDYLNDAELQDRCLIVRYEELISQTRSDSAVLSQICHHTGISLTDKMYEELGVLVDSSCNGSKLSSDELETIGEIVGTANLLGYDKP